MMARGSTTKIWNKDLARAFEARMTNAQLQNKARWLSWQRAATSVSVQEAPIFVDKGGRCINLPAELSWHELAVAEQIMRGEVAIMPASVQQALPAQNPPVLLLENVQYRKGAYAILMVFHEVFGPPYKGELLKAQLVSFGQHFCDASMRATPRERGEWESGRHSLVRDKLMVMSERGSSSIDQQTVGEEPSNAAGPIRFSLSPEGCAFLPRMLEIFGDATKGHVSVPSTVKSKVDLVHVGDHALSLDQVAADDDESIFTLRNHTDTSCKTTQALGSGADDESATCLALMVTVNNTASGVAGANKRACPDGDVEEAPPSTTTKRRAISAGDMSSPSVSRTQCQLGGASASHVCNDVDLERAIAISLKESQTPPPRAPRAAREVYEIDGNNHNPGFGPGGAGENEDEQMARAITLSIMEQEQAASSSLAAIPTRSDPCASGVRQKAPCSSLAPVVVLDHESEEKREDDQHYRQAIANSLQDPILLPPRSKMISNKNSSQAASFRVSGPEPDCMEFDSTSNMSTKGVEIRNVAAAVPSQDVEVTLLQESGSQDTPNVHSALSLPIELEPSPPIPSTQLIQDNDCTQPSKKSKQEDVPVVNILINMKGGIPTAKQLNLLRQVQGALHETVHTTQFTSNTHQSQAKLCRLEVGDFMCELGERNNGQSDIDYTVLGYAVQRKTIRDLVWRGEEGEHLEQLGRLMSSPFKRSCLFLEGDPEEASSFSAYGAGRHAINENRLGQISGVQSAHDVCKLEAWVIAAYSNTRVLHTKDEMGTFRTLAFLALLAAELFSTEEGRDVHSLATVNAQFTQEEAGKRKLLFENVLVAAGAPAGTVALLVARFDSVENLRRAYSLCKSDVHRACLAASLLTLGERRLCEWSYRVWQAICAGGGQPASLAVLTNHVLEGVPCMEPQLNVTAGPSSFEWVCSWMPAGGIPGVFVAPDPSLHSATMCLRTMHGRLQSASCLAVVLQGQEFLEELLGICINLRIGDSQVHELAMRAGAELHNRLWGWACPERQAANTQHVLVVTGLNSAMEMLRKGKQLPSANQEGIECGALLLKLGLVEFVDMCICLLVVKFRWHVHNSSTEQAKAQGFFEALFKVYREHALPYGC